MKRSVFALAALLGGIFLGQDRGSPLFRGATHEHEEARAKRVLAKERSALRAASGVPDHAEGYTRGVDVLSYDLSFTLDPAVRALEGRAVIRVGGVLPSTSSLTLQLDDVYTVTELSRDGKVIAPLARSAGRLVIPFDPPLRAEERATLTVAYAGVPPSYGAIAFWKSSSGSAATSVAEPFDAPTFWPCVDDPADRAVVTVRATIPAGYTAASAGLSTTETAEGRKTVVWRLPQKISSYLVSLNVAPYVTIEGKYVSLDGSRTMPVVSYVLPEHVAAAQPRVEAMPEEIGVFASLFGEYPFLDTKYGIVESAFSGGMEHPTMTSIGTSNLSSTRDLTTLFVHELSHQWWGDRVTMKTWDDLFLNEGFATYAEILYLEKTRGYLPGPLLSAAYDDGLYGGALAPPVVASPADPFRNSGSVYDKGAWVLHMLRRLVGDEVFFRALRRYGDEHALGNATRADLRDRFEKESGLDLKAFFDQWLETPFRPVLRATFTEALDFSSVTLKVAQIQTHAVAHPLPAASDAPWYRFPLTVKLELADGTSQETTVSLDASTSTFEIPVSARKRVVNVVLDPHADLLKVVESVTEGP